MDSCEKLFEADERGLNVSGMEEEQARYLKRRMEVAQVQRIMKEGGDLGEFLDDALGVSEYGVLEVANGRVRVSDTDNCTREWWFLAHGDFDRDGPEDVLMGVNLYIADESLLFGSRLLDECGIERSMSGTRCLF